MLFLLFKSLYKMPLKVKTQIVDYSGLICPFRAGVFGSTRTGKTTLIYEILKRKYFHGVIDNIYYSYPSVYSKQPLDWHSTLPYNVKYIDYLPNLEFIQSTQGAPLTATLILERRWRLTEKVAVNGAVRRR